MEHVEIERKWKPDALPEAALSCPYTEIEQGYLCRSPVVRVRKDGEAYYLTYKGEGLLKREEYNLPLTKAAYETLIGKSEGRLIQKRRYRMPVVFGSSLEKRRYTAEIDVFSGELTGLFLVEVEFPSEEEACAFTAPSWFGREVTEDPAYSNSFLSSL